MQYGTLTTWRVSDEGTFVSGDRVSDVHLTGLDLDTHHSTRLRVGVDVDEGAANRGGINIFGRGFGNHDQDIIMRLFLDPALPK